MDLREIKLNQLKNDELIEIYTKTKEEELNEVEDIILEIKSRVNKFNSIPQNPEIEQIENELKKIDEIDLFEKEKTSYEKMNLDKLLFVLRRFYKNNLEQINNNILNCITKFAEAGIELKPEDFNYSPFAQKYMKVFFEEYKNGDINSPKMKETFEKLYWECSDIIVHIELNVRYLYLKNEKKIEKNINSENTENDYLEKSKLVKIKLDELKEKDKRIILDKFLNKELDEKNYEIHMLQSQYAKILTNSYDTYTNIEKKEINDNIVKLAQNLDEYQNYLKYKFIIDEILKIYKEKDKHQNVYEKKKKEIQKKENKLFKANKKYDKQKQLKDKRFFKTNSVERLKLLAIDINNQILEIKELYRELELEKINYKISTSLTNSSTIYEALFLSGAYYIFLVKVIIKQYPEIQEQEINDMVEEIRQFIKNPYITIINNITIKDEKNILLMIKDKYNLCNINIAKSDLEESSISELANTVDIILNVCNLEKSGLDIEDIKFLMKAKKILQIEYENKNLDS